MTNLLIKISVSICLFIFSFLSSAYYYPPPAPYHPPPAPYHPPPAPYYPPPAPNYLPPALNYLPPAHYYPPVQQSTCPYNLSSVCRTYRGNACSLFVPNYQNNWFSACINPGYLSACLNVPVFPYHQLVQNTCYPRGASCTCAFGTYNGYYIYEPGQIL